MSDTARYITEDQLYGEMPTESTDVAVRATTPPPPEDPKTA